MLHLDVNKLKVFSAITEIRFAEIFTLPELKFKILERLAKLYPTYDVSKADQLFMTDADQRIMLFTEINRTAFEWAQPASINDYLSVSRFALESIIDAMGVKSVKRIGARTQFVYAVDSSLEATEYLVNRYLSASARKVAQSADEVLFPAVAFMLRKGSIKYNLQIRYQEHQNLTAKLDEVVKRERLDQILFDFDVFKDSSISRSKLPDFWDELRTSLTADLPEYIRIMEG